MIEIESAMAYPAASAVESPISVTPVPTFLPSDRETPPKSSRQVSKFEDVYNTVGRSSSNGIPITTTPRTAILTMRKTSIKLPIPSPPLSNTSIKSAKASWLGNCFKPIDMSKAKLSKKMLYDEISKAKLSKKMLYDEILEGVDLAITEINIDLSGGGKRIELVELVKVVEAAAPTMQLLTLKVKEVDADGNGETKIIQAIVFEGYGDMPPLSLKQWRYKPVEGDDFWYKAPPVDAAKYAAIYGDAA